MSTNKKHRIDRLSINRNSKTIKSVSRELMQIADAMDLLGMVGAERLRTSLCEIERLSLYIERATQSPTP